MAAIEVSNEDKLTWRHIGLAFTAACFSFFAVALMFNAAGVFYSYVAEEFGCGLGKITIYITLSYIGAMALLPIGGGLMDKIDARWIYVVTNIALVLAFVIMANAQSVWMFYISGILMCCGTAFDMYLMPVLVARWFKKSCGLVVGIAGSMSGLGAALWNIVLVAIIGAGSWRTGYWFNAAAILVVLVPLSLIFVRSNPESVGVHAYGWSTMKNDDGTNVKLVGADKAKVLKTAAYPIMIIMCMCGGLCAMMSQYLTSFSVSVGYEASVGAVMTSACFIGTMLAKIVLGWIADRNVFVAYCGAIFLPIIGFAGLMLIGGGAAKGVIAMAFLYGTVQPSNTVLMPLVVQKTFGEKDYGKIWGAISPFSALACAIGGTIWGWIFDFTGSFYMVFTIGIVLLAIRFFCWFFAMKSAKKVPWTEEGSEEEKAANATA